MSTYTRGLNHSPTIGGTGLNIDQVDEGSLLIGNGVDFDLSTLTAGEGITIVNGDGAITISGTALYVLPIASDTILGGIKVGSGLSIDGGGVLSAERESIYHSGLLVGTRPNLNLIDGTNIDLTVADNPGTDAVDLTINADKKWILRETGDPDYTIADGDDSLVSNNLYLMEAGVDKTLHLPDVTTISDGLLLAVKAYGGIVTVQAATGQFIDQGGDVSDIIVIGVPASYQHTILLLSDNSTENSPGWDVMAIYTDTALYGEAIYKNGMFVGQRPTLNFIEGTSVTLGVVDDSIANKVDITISSTGSGGDWVQLEQQELSVAGSFIFSSISSSYTNLKVLITGRGGGAVASRGIFLTINGDFGLNYYLQYNTSSSSTDTNTQNLGINFPRIATIPAANAPSLMVGSVELTFYNYSNTVFGKGFTFQGIGPLNTTTGNLKYITGGGFWNSASAINTILLGLDSDNFVIGSVATLYGLK